MCGLGRDTSSLMFERVAEEEVPKRSRLPRDGSDVSGMMRVST